MSHSLPACLVSVVILGLSGVACSPQRKAPAPDPAALLQSVPPADPGKYQRVADMRNWRNPYLLVRADGVALLDPADSAELVLKPDEVLAALARLPASAWPYGRVVAISESAARGSEQDGVAIRRNKGIVGGILEGAHVAIDWVPSP
ncbi:MAG: hypothetical protein WCA16_20730 [Candidatus Sulfotelmatobacter sp.]